MLRRSSGELTYFASDIAYHQDKRERGYDQLINLLGADHHGYQGRMHALFGALGDPGKLELIIMQLVHFVERGERAKMSKRRGDFVTLDELLDDIGVDAARWFMLARSHDTPLDIDLDLARERSQDNPVYYVQYAHARIAAILRKAGEERVARARAADLGAGRAKLEPAERALVKRLLELPGEVVETGERRAPHRLTKYAHDVASDFHAFYRDCRVVGAEPAELEDFRLVLCEATRHVIARVLDLAGRRGAGEHVSVAAGLDTLAHRLRPARGEPAGALVLLHGRGVDESDLFPLLDAFDPDARLVGATPRGAADAAARRLPLVHRGAGRFPAPRDVHGELSAADRVARGACARRPACPGSGR